MTHIFLNIEESQNLLTQQKLIVLTNPFPQGQNIMQNASKKPNVARGNQGSPMQESGTSNVYMMNLDLHLQIRARDYGNIESKMKDKESKKESNSLHIEKPMAKRMPRILKVVYKWSSHNLNAREAQNYSIVEYLEQTPCVISSLEACWPLIMESYED
jgi:hypothetical protein